MTIDNISNRWTEERSRLGFSQADWARIMGVTRETMRNWENGIRIVNADALAIAFKLGADVQYIVTGIRSSIIQQTPMVSNQVNNSGSASNIALGGSTINQISTRKYVTKTEAIVRPGEDHISDEQAAALHKLVVEIIETETKLKKKAATPRSVWASLNAHMKVPKYRLIPFVSFEKAQAYLNQWIGRLNSSDSASVKNGDAWRKRHIAYIKINSKNPDDAAAVVSYMRTKLSSEKVSELPNDELEKLYRYVASRRNKAK